MEDHNSILSYQDIPPTLSEQLTANFYQWEKRGRGWQVFEYPVDLEPSFEPFFHFVPLAPPGFDDGRAPGLMKLLFSRFKGMFSGNLDFCKESYPETWTFYEPSPEPCPRNTPPEPVSVILPPNFETNREESEQFLLSLGHCTAPLSFEIIAGPEKICIQLTSSPADLARLKEQLKIRFPEVILSQSCDHLLENWDQKGKESLIVDFGLCQEFMLPIRTYSSFRSDPLSGIIGALSELRASETAALQILFQAALNPWAESILRAVYDPQGKSFFQDAPSFPKLALTKTGRPFFAAIARLAVQSPHKDRLWQIARSATSSMNQFADPTSNELIPLDNEEYSDLDHQRDLLLRQSRRIGMLLNSEELISILHLPFFSVQSEKLERRIEKTKPVPQSATGYDIVLGENIHDGEKTPVTLGPEHRIRHTYVIGASGTGKSTLLLNMILQDIHNGSGLGVLDPHGDLIDEILKRIPRNRHQDVILFDPSDEEYPVGFNIFQAQNELEKNLLSSDLTALFRRLSTSWGDQMNSVLANAVLAMLESDQGGTLFDLRRFLIEEDFRSRFLETVKDPHTVYYWKKEFPLLRAKPQASILTRLDSFLRPKLIRNIIAQKENRLDFSDIMNSGKILLAKLVQGAIGEENSYLLGTLLVSAIHKSALARQKTEQSQRQDFFLYIDEFQNFITPSMEAVLSGARKYRLGLVLAHQELQQLMERDRKVAASVLSNPCTRICFRLGESDARKLRDGFSFFDEKDLQNLGTGEAICRIERSDQDFNLRTYPTAVIDEQVAAWTKEKLIDASRQKYAGVKPDLESLLPQAEPKKAKAETSIRESETKPKEEAWAGQTEHTEKPLSSPEKEKAAPEKDQKTKNQPRGKKGVSSQELKKEQARVLEHASPSSQEKIQKINREVKSSESFSGRGGTKHKYLQQLIKRFAEDKGYKAVLEKTLSGGTIVDISLENEDKEVACQVCVTTPERKEIENIQSCLDSGYDQVILLATDKRVLNKASRLAEQQMSGEEQNKISFYNLEEFFGFLEKEQPKEETVAGYRVKVRRKPLSKKEEEDKKKSVSKVVLGSLKKMKEK